MLRFLVLLFFFLRGGGGGGCWGPLGGPGAGVDGASCGHLRIEFWKRNFSSSLVLPEPSWEEPSLH